MTDPNLPATTTSPTALSIEEPAQHYSREALWAKLKRFALRLGRGSVQTTLTLFYCLQDKETPAWAKGVIMGALGYLILPVDAIPDFIPVVGFSDDLGAISAALGTVAVYVKDVHKRKAREQMARLFQMILPDEPSEATEVAVSQPLEQSAEVPVHHGQTAPTSASQLPGSGTGQKF